MKMLRWIVAVFVFLGFSDIPLLGQGQITNVYGRKTTSVNGVWQIIIDQYDYYSGSRARNISRNYVAQNKTERLEYAFTNSNTLLVPGDWNTQNEKLFFYEGSVWYKKDLEYYRKQDSRAILYFGAVNYRAEVYLNGTLLGTHEGGFTPFSFECTDKIKNGTNVLVVRVNNVRQSDRVPALDFDWWNFGGITRDVMVVELPSSFIEDYSLRLRNGDASTIEGWVKIDGEEIPETIELSIDELNIHAEIKSNGRSPIRFAVRAKPHLWSPENPRIYDVSIRANKDTVRDRIGFRTVAARGQKILLNGEAIFLRGISLHEEALFTGGRISTAAQVRSLFQYAKEMNCNFIRLAHYPHSEEALRLADEMGFLVWAEVPVWQNIPFKSEKAINSARQQLEEMIVRDKNRASIILWSVSNETDRSKEGRMEFLRSMIDLARSLDPTRLITSAMDKQVVNDTTLRFTDPLGEYLDVLAVNEYIGWYQGLPADCQKLRWETIYDKPHLISEFGGEALYGFHADSMTIWSEEFQASLYRNQLGMIDRVPFISGTSPWILKDFRSPRRLNPDYQSYWNRKGVISNEGQRKLSFYVMKEYYQHKAMKAKLHHQ